MNGSERYPCMPLGSSWMYYDPFYSRHLTVMPPNQAGLSATTAAMNRQCERELFGRHTPSPTPESAEQYHQLDDSMVTKRRRSRLAKDGIEDVQKPVMVEQYNTYMGGVDKADQLISYYGFSHRTVKWWRRAFFHL